MRRSPHLGRFAVAAAVLLLAACSGGVAPTGADQRRVDEVHAIAALVEQYHARAGRYPLAERGAGTFIRATLDEGGAQAFPGAVSGLVFVEELRAVLGAQVEVPTDPEAGADGGLRGYHYGTDGQNYSVAAFLTQATSYTRPFGERLHLYEVGSVDKPESRIWNYRKMLAGEYRP